VASDRGAVARGAVGPAFTVPRLRQTVSRAARDEIVLAISYIILGAAAYGLSRVGLGVAAEPFYIISAIGMAAIAKRKSPWLFLDATLWFWVFTPMIRRLIEWHTGFTHLAIILITPNLLTLLMLPDMLGKPGLHRRKNIGYPAVLTACTLYGLCVSFVNGDILAGCFAATDWLTPLFYLFFFISTAERIGEFKEHFETFLALSLPILIGYSIWQYFAIPAWDALWLVQSGLAMEENVKGPVLQGTRIFGPLNNPGFLASWCGASLILLPALKPRVMVLLAPVLIFVVAVIQVRSVYGGIALGLAAGAIAGRGGFKRLAMLLCLSVVTLFMGTALLDSVVVDQISSRFGTMFHLSQDYSAQEREVIAAQVPKVIERYPFGLGIAAQGRGKGVTADETQAVDSGILSDMLGLGVAFGSLRAATLIWLQVLVVLLSRKMRSPFASVMASASLCTFAMYPFINVLGFWAVMMYIYAGYVLAVDTQRSPDGGPSGRRLA
jgi:hypothetical protein